MRRIVKWFVIAIIILLVPFGALMLAIPLLLASKISRVDADWRPASRVIAWSFVWCAVYRVPFNFALSLLYNERASEPRKLRDAELNALGIDGPATGYPVGDIGDSRGPSLGPGNVLRANVERLWRDVNPLLGWFVIATAPEDLALVGNERKAMWVAIKMMREVLAQANGNLWNAAKRYNGGSGQDPRALAYADKAIDTIARLG